MTSAVLGVIGGSGIYDLPGLEDVREAQRRWAAWSIEDRLKIVRRVREAIALQSAEFATVLKSMNPDGVADQQIKVVDIGKYNVAVGILHRSGKAKQSAIAHSQITEIYYVIDCAGTFVTGGTMTTSTVAAPEGNTV